MDGIGDNADTDDDNDGWSDNDESVCGTDPRDSSVLPDDYDSDMICDVVDDDDDNDGFTDDNDVFPCLLYTSPSPRDVEESRMPSSA